MNLTTHVILCILVLLKKLNMLSSCNGQGHFAISESHRKAPSCIEQGHKFITGSKCLTTEYYDWVNNICCAFFFGKSWGLRRSVSLDGSCIQIVSSQFDNYGKRDIVCPYTANSRRVDKGGDLIIYGKIRRRLAKMRGAMIRSKGTMRREHCRHVQSKR